MKLLLIIFLSLFIRSAFSQVYVTVPYRVKEPESLTDSMRKFIKIGKVLSRKSRSLQKTMNLYTGPSPLSWNTLPAGFEIDLYIDSEIVDIEKVSSLEVEKIPSPEVEKNPSPEVDKNLQKNAIAYRKKMSSSVFFAASRGSFQQTSALYPDVTFGQNSPYTLGLSTNYRHNYAWSTSASLYISALKATGSNLNTQKVSLPHEVGANLYAERFFQTGTVTLYAGADYEQFSTFNLPGIEQTGKISVDSNQIYYLTFGFSKNFTLFGKSFFSKLSSSKSISSSYRSGTTNPGYDGALQGYKFLAFISTNIANNFSLNLFVKQHLMQAEYDLGVLRQGIGFSYNF